MITRLPAVGYGLLVHIGERAHERRAEWIAAFQLLLFGIVLLHPQELFFGSAAFAVFKSIASENTWGSVIMSIGVLRMASLVVNGAMQRTTAWTRLLTSFAGCGVFTAVSLCFAASGILGPWAAAWPIAAVVEFLNIYATTKDARDATVDRRAY